jgi:hypothetical protein
VASAAELLARVQASLPDELVAVVSAFLAGTLRSPRPGELVGALCAEVDPALWYPGPGENDRLVAAQAVCCRCDVRAACLAFALSHSDMEEGVWAGLSWRSLRAIRGERRRRELAARRVGEAA